MKHNSYFILLLILLSFASCKRKEVKGKWSDTFRSGFIKIAGDESFKAMIDAQVTSFEAHHNYQALVMPVYNNEKEIIRLLIEDSVRLAITSRDMTKEENTKLEAQSRFLKKYIIAFDGIALITNQMNPDSILGISTIEKILTGEITEWSQVNPKTPLGAIRVLFDNKESSILRYVVDSITGTKPLSSNLYALANSLEVMEKVIEMPNTIGLVGASILSDEVKPELRELKKQVRPVRISREEKPKLENSYLPYAGDIIQENYPFWRPVYALLTDPSSGLSSGFTVFLSQEIGQRIILKSGLLPITSPHVRNVRMIDAYPDENSRSRTIN